jgi:hypothetical protein
MNNRILKRSYFILWASLGLIFFVIGCGSSYTITKDEKGKTVVTGLIRWEEWQKVADWESYTAGDYTPDNYLVRQLAAKIKSKHVEFYLFAGSWCDDSKSEVPKIYKLFTLAGFLPEKIMLYGVDRQKREPSGAAELFKIEKVPTLVVVLGTIELGRIVEYPQKSWEYDLIQIIGD